MFFSAKFCPFFRVFRVQGPITHTVSETEKNSILSGLILRKSVTYQIFVGKFLFRNHLEHIFLYQISVTFCKKTVWRYQHIIYCYCPSGQTVLPRPIQPLYKVRYLVSSELFSNTIQHTLTGLFLYFCTKN